MKLTNLVLAEGYRPLCQPQARAASYVPTRLWAACTLFQHRWGTRALRAET